MLQICSIGEYFLYKYWISVFSKVREESKHIKEALQSEK